MTSRERNPQFCGSPPRFRDRGFYSIQPEELSCTKKDSTTISSISTSTTSTTPREALAVIEPPKEPVGVATVISADLDDLVAAQPDLLVPSSTSIKTPTGKTTTITTSTSVSTSSTTTRVTSTTTTDKSTTAKSKGKSSVSPVWKSSPRPSMVLGFPSRNRAEDNKEVIVKDAYRQDNSVIIKWSSDTSNILGFRVVYRLFGDKSFKQGPPLEASEREFKIKNVPSQVKKYLL